MEQIVPWTSDVEYEPVFNLGGNMMESFARLNRVEQLCKKFPGLDCGSCGAPTCKALAEDIVRGEAEEKDCIHLLRDNLHKLSQDVSLMADCLIDGENFDDSAIYVLRECVHKIADEMARLDRKPKENKEQQ